MREFKLIRSNKKKGGGAKALPLIITMDNHYTITQQLQQITSDLKAMQHDITTIKSDLKQSQIAIQRIEGYMNNDPATGSIGIVNKVNDLEKKYHRMQNEYLYMKGKLVAFGMVAAALTTIIIQWLKSLMQ